MPRVFISKSVTNCICPVLSLDIAKILKENVFFLFIIYFKHTDNNAGMEHKQE